MIPLRVLSSTCAALLLTAATATARAQWGAQPQPAPTASQPPPNPFGGMQSGGLAPPPPLPLPSGPPPGSGQTEQQLDKAKSTDAGRGIEWAWSNVEGGFGHTGLRTFNPHDDSFTAGFVDTTASGGQIGAALGARLLFFTVGARGRIGFYSAYRIFSVGGEGGFHIPIGAFDPHVDLGAGYATLASIKDAVTGGESPMGIHGFYVRAGGGLDYYLSHFFSLGLNVSWELLGLTRPALSPDDLAKLKASPSLNDADRSRADRLSSKDTSFGSALAVTGLVGLHF